MSTAAMLRAAGQLGDVGVVNDHGHNISAEPGDLCNRCHFGGEFHTATVECVDCHAPHGTNYYRNLQWASWPGHQPPIVAFVNPGAAGLQKYQASNVKYGAPGDGPGQPTWREVTNICIDCHHNVHDAAPMADGTPITISISIGIDIPAPTPSAARIARSAVCRAIPATAPTALNWFEGEGSEFAIGRLPYLVEEAHDYASASVVAYNNEVFCLSCHSAHGSEFSFGLRWNAAESSNPMRTAGCRQCHNNTTGNID